MLKIVKPHTRLIGKIAKLTELGVCLEQAYYELFKIGCTRKTNLLFEYMHHEKYEISLMFIDEEPFSILSQTWYCLKEIGKGANGDYHWFTLEQLMICE